MAENEIIRLRYEKIAKIREAGVNPYNNTFIPAHLVRDLRTKFNAASAEDLEKMTDEYSVAGRILRLNFMGKSNFIGIRDYTGEIQILSQPQGPGRKKIGAP